MFSSSLISKCKSSTSLKYQSQSQQYRCQNKWTNVVQNHTTAFESGSLSHHYKRAYCTPTTSFRKERTSELQKSPTTQTNRNAPTTYKELSPEEIELLHKLKNEDPIKNTNLVLANKFSVTIPEIRRALRTAVTSATESVESNDKTDTTSAVNKAQMHLTQLTLPRRIEDMHPSVLLGKLDHQLSKLQYFGKRILETPQNPELKTKVLQCTSEIATLTTLLNPYRMKAYKAMKQHGLLDDRQENEEEFVALEEHQSARRLTSTTSNRGSQ